MHILHPAHPLCIFCGRSPSPETGIVFNEPRLWRLLTANYDALAIDEHPARVGTILG